MNEYSNLPVDSPGEVAATYESQEVATSYIGRRMHFSWQRLLHLRQVSILRAQLAALRPPRVLELAPGPARLSVELPGIEQGTMIENSAEMLAIARARLKQAGVADRWRVVQGDAFHLVERITNRSFEFAYTFRFIRHFRRPERLKLYEQIGACLVDHGTLIFDVVNAKVRGKLDARHRGKPRPSGELSIYDACYARHEFRQEMRAAGFDVLSLFPVLTHFRLQASLSYKLDDVLPRFVPPVIRFIEQIPVTSPLEWVAVCRKR